MATFSALYLIVFVFGVVLAICWIVLPFALIGTKPLLRQLIAETQRTNALLEGRLPDLNRRPMRDDSAVIPR